MRDAFSGSSRAVDLLGQPALGVEGVEPLVGGGVPRPGAVRAEVGHGGQLARSVSVIVVIRYLA